MSMFDRELIKALREEATRQMPEGADKYSSEWYVYGAGQKQRELAELLRAAAARIEAEL